jgi:hypothetical protein
VARRKASSPGATDAREARRGDLLGRRIGAEAKPNVATKQALAFHPLGQQGRSPERLAAFSDDALALRFAELHAGDLRYVAKWSIWMRWDGTRWQADDTLAVFDSARAVCRAAAESAKPPLAQDLTSAKTVAAARAAGALRPAPRCHRRSSGTRTRGCSTHRRAFDLRTARCARTAPAIISPT